MQYMIILLTVLVVCDCHSICNHYNITSSNTEVQNTLITGCNKFGLTLLHTIARYADDNLGGIFISPFSIWSALVIAYYGSRTSTQSELAEVLGLGELNKAEVSIAHRSLIRHHPSYNLASRLYIQQGLQLDTCFLNNYKGNIGFVDFSNDPEFARQNINFWVARQTSNKIRSLLPPSSVNTDTRLILANAIYFHAFWSKPFNSSQTRRKSFTVSLSEEITVEMMSTSGRYIYASDKELQCSVIQLPYGEQQDLFLMILLPDHLYFGLKIFEQLLTDDNLSRLRQKLRYRDMYIELPKFQMNTSYDLVQTLHKMKLREIFHRGEADLSGLIHGINNIAIDQVRHKAAIEIAENGTTASASTYIQFTTRSGQRAHPTSFIVNRTFFFIIIDSTTQIPLFMGNVWRPTY